MEGKINKGKILFGCLILLAAVAFFHHCKPAVLIAPDNSILYVSVNPSYIPVGGTTTVKVMGYKPSGTPLPDGTVIFFNCDMGTIESQSETNGGIAYAAFTSNDNRSGVANITVISGNAQMSPESVTITIGGGSLHSLSISAGPQVLPVGGGAAGIIIIAYDENLNPLPNIPLTLTTDAGQLDSSGNTIYTDAGGRAEDVLHTTTSANITVTSGTVSAQITITVQSNENPTASFVYSPNNPIEGQKVYFNAAGSSDPDGNIVSYEWDFGDGRTAAGQTTDHKYRQPGTFTVLLTVQDNNGNRASTSQNISVGDNETPTASFGYSPTSPNVGEDIYFNAADSTDPDGEIEAYEWDFGDGTTDTGESVTHSYSSAGTYRVMLAVIDDSGNRGSTSQNISVGDSQSPTASFVYSPTSPGTGEDVYFNASDSSDPDGYIVSYAWDFGDGTAGSGETPTHRYSDTGNYTVFLEVTDDSGKTGNTSRSITISGGQSPTASFVYSPSSPAVGEQVHFNASESSDPDGTIAGYRWDMGDGTTRSGRTTGHTYANAGTYTVLLVVTDNNGNTGSASRTVAVGDNQSPAASFVYSPSAPRVNDNVYFNAAGSSDPDGSITSYQWDFGDGNTGSGVNTNHGFTSAGTYTVVLVVTDDGGNQDSVSQDVTVTI